VYAITYFAYALIHF